MIQTKGTPGFTGGPFLSFSCGDPCEDVVDGDVLAAAGELTFGTVDAGQASSKSAEIIA